MTKSILNYVDRGTNGNAIPLCIIFPRVRFDEARMMMYGVVSSYKGLIHPNWMDMNFKFCSITTKYQKQDKLDIEVDQTYDEDLHQLEGLLKVELNNNSQRRRRSFIFVEIDSVKGNKIYYVGKR